MTEHAKAAAHYNGVLERADEVKRVTIEAYCLDADVDLAACTFEFGPMLRGTRRVITKPLGRATEIVGLWRIVPDEAAR